MSQISIFAFNPPGVRHNVLAAVLGDVLDLHPIDMRFSYTYAVSSAPEGSSAAFSGSTFTPDVVGSYVVTVTGGSDTLTVPLFVYALAVKTGLKPRSVADVAYSDAEARQLLQAVADGLPPAILVAWNAAPTVPPYRIVDFGAR